MSKNVLRVIISTGAIVVIMIRHLFPQLHIDTIDLVLIAILVLPWLSELIKEIEVPGFGKIGFQEVKSAGDKIGLPSTSLNQESFYEKDSNSYIPSSANALFVIIRYQIEKRVRQLAEFNKIPISVSLTKLISELVHREILKPSMGNGLIDLVRIGNQAAHGARVDPHAELWAKENSEKIFEALDDVIDSSQEQTTNKEASNA